MKTTAPLTPVRVAAAALWLVVALQPAQADTLAERAAGRVDGERAVLSLALTQDVLAGAAAATQPLASTSGTTTQSMLWARRQALSVGLGVEQRSNQGLDLRASPSATGTPALQRQRVLVGVMLATSERTSIELQAPVWADHRDMQAPAPAGMALRSRDPLGDLRVGMLMKMKMSEQTTVALRPRKGGVGVTLRSQW